jgi:hypothetical protein
MSNAMPPEPPPPEGEAAYFKATKTQVTTAPTAAGQRVDPQPPAFLLDQPATPEINAAVAKVLAESSESVPKRGHNSFHNYDYATADDLRLYVGQRIGKHGLSYQQHNAGYVPTGHGSMVEVSFWFVLKHSSGEMWPPQHVPVLTTLTSNKGGPDDKAMSKAMVLALKDWGKSAFSIPTGDKAEDPDYDEASPQQPTTNRAPSRAPAGNPAFRSEGLPPKIKPTSNGHDPETGEVEDPWLDETMNELAAAAAKPDQWVNLLTQKLIPGCQTITQLRAVEQLQPVKNVRAKDARTPQKVRKQIDDAFTTAAKRLTDSTLGPAPRADGQSGEGAAA